MTPRRHFSAAPGRAALGALLVGGLLAAPLAPLSTLAAPPAQIEGLETQLRGENVRVRLDPGDDAEEIAILQDGEPVEVTGPGEYIDGHAWWPILVLDSGDEGWVRWEFLVSGTPVLAEPPADDAADDGGQDRQRNRNRNRDDGNGNDADATAAPVAASPLPFSASGDAGVTEAGSFASPGGRLVYVAVHEGDGPFVVTIVDADGEEQVVIEEDGVFDGQSRLRTPEGATSVRVDASGPWTLGVAETAPAAAAGVPGAAAVPADDVPAGDAPEPAAEVASTLPFTAAGDAGIIDAGEFASPGGRLFYTATHEGDGPFIVSLVDPDGAEEIVIEADGVYDDQVRFRTGEGPFSILVDASGPWTIEVSESAPDGSAQASGDDAAAAAEAAAADAAAEDDAAADTAAADLPFTASGNAGIIDAGDFTSPGGRLTYVATHDGDGPFIVSLVDPDGAEEIVIEADGVYDDQVRFRTAEGDWSILVDASGPWTLDVQPPS